MNELQLKELSVLLETFSRRYPDRSPDNIKKPLEEALTALSEVKSLTAQDATALRERREQNAPSFFLFKGIYICYICYVNHSIFCLY